MEAKMDIKGLVLPPRTTALVVITDESISCELTELMMDGDMQIASVTYPDGFTKSHQADDVADLLTKVTGTLRARYGVREFNFSAVPEKLEKGVIISMGDVKYDTQL